MRTTWYVLHARRSITIIIVIVSILMVSLSQVSIMSSSSTQDTGQNYYSSVLRISRSYSDQRIWVWGNVEDHHTVPTGAMELQYYIERNITETNDQAADTGFYFKAVWAYSNNKDIESYYVEGNVNLPAKAVAYKYRLSILNTYYTDVRNLTGVSFTSIYAFDQDVGGDENDDFVINLIMNALQYMWDFTVNKIPIPLPNPWQVFKIENPENQQIGIPILIYISHDELEDINYGTMYTLPLKSGEQYYRRVFGIGTYVEIGYYFENSNKYDEDFIVILWSFQPDIHYASYPLYNDASYIDIPQSSEPILFAYLTHKIIYNPYQQPPSNSPTPI